MLYMLVIGQLYAPAALPSGKWPSVLVERKGAKAPEPFNGKERNFSLLGGEFQSFTP
jgi:hypothetical protein